MDSDGHILMRDHCTKYYIFHDHLFLCMQIVQSKVMSITLYIVWDQIQG